MRCTLQDIVSGGLTHLELIFDEVVGPSEWLFTLTSAYLCHSRKLLSIFRFTSACLDMTTVLVTVSNKAVLKLPIVATCIEWYWTVSEYCTNNIFGRDCGSHLLLNRVLKCRRQRNFQAMLYCRCGVNVAFATWVSRAAPGTVPSGGLCRRFHFWVCLRHLPC